MTGSTANHANDLTPDPFTAPSEELQLLKNRVGMLPYDNHHADSGELKSD